MSLLGGVWQCLKNDGRKRAQKKGKILRCGTAVRRERKSYRLGEHRLKVEGGIVSAQCS